MTKSDEPADQADIDEAELIAEQEATAAPGDRAEVRAEAIDDLAAKQAANKAAQREAEKEAAREAKKSARKAADIERDEKRAAKAIDAPSPGWWVPTLCAFMVIGLFWLVVYYLSAEKYPIPGIGLGNMAIGFVLILVGFGMTTRWR
ncbi:cell division protein CrgA [Flexivirga caeni]|uniref:Cell division protein CrgA n=1 Tax=Flexivirga caeni TaxID=2294115 RepID=A0A3M9M2A9_9MICO|nr:cell division protein CrgA [Flexivirga caeni]RNI19680.1 cell division protein CrgA [Flexivirga caeni]